MLFRSILKHREAIHYNQGSEAAAEGYQIEHVDVSPPIHIQDTETLKRCCCLLQPAGSRPAILWAPLQENTGIAVFLGSHKLVSASYQFVLDNFQRLETFRQGSRQLSDEVSWNAALNHCTHHYLKLLRPNDQSIEGKLLVPDAYQPVIIDGNLVHCGSNDPGHRIFDLLVPKVIFYHQVYFM